MAWWLIAGLLAICATGYAAFPSTFGTKLIVPASFLLVSFLVWLLRTRPRKPLSSLQTANVLWAGLLASSFDLGVRASADPLAALTHPAGILRLAALASATLYGLLFLTRKQRSWRPVVSTSLALFLVYLGACLLFALVSERPLYSAYKAIEATAPFIFLIAVIGRSPEAQSSLWRTTIMVLAIAVGAILMVSMLDNESAFRRASYSALASGLRWEPPILLTANGLGAVAAIMAGVAFSAFMIPQGPHRRAVYLVMFLVCGSLVYLSQARTSLLALSTLIILCLVLSRRQILLRLLITMAMIVVIVGPARIELRDFMIRGMSNEHFWDMSGRVSAWKLSLQAVSEQPLIGRGFGVGSRAIVEGSALNGLLEVLLAIGIVGAVPFVLAIGIMFVAGMRIASTPSIAQRDSTFWVFVLPVMIISVFRTVTSIGAGGWLTNDFLLFALVLVSISSRSAVIRAGNGRTPASYADMQYGPVAARQVLPPQT